MLLFARNINIDGTTWPLVKLADWGDGWVDAWAWRDRRPVLAGSVESGRLVTRPSGDIEVHGPDGLVWVAISGGCGCGDPLKNFTPPQRSDAASWAALANPLPTS